MFEKILLPLDGSDLAEVALEPALRLLHPVQGELICLSATAVPNVYVHDHGSYGYWFPEQLIEDSEQEMVAYLDGLKERLAGSNVHVRACVATGDAASTIVDTAASENADLIVMSTHGRTGLSRWLMGSVAEKVLQDAPCPVLIIREPTLLSRILITLDGSSLSEQALEPGMIVAQQLNSEVTLFCADCPQEVDHQTITELDNLEPGLGAIAKDTIKRKSSLYLDEVAQRYEQAVHADIRVISAKGAAAEHILSYIDQNEFDLVVMATHGRTGLRRWVYGSVTEKVLRGARCAMLIVRPSEAQLN